MVDVVASEALPTAAEYIELRAKAGWGSIDEETAIKTIHAAAFTISLRYEQRLIGLARVMGDGVLYFFLADLIVDPELRGERLGDRLMRLVTSYFDRFAAPGASIDATRMTIIQPGTLAVSAPVWRPPCVTP